LNQFFMFWRNVIIFKKKQLLLILDLNS
jgi:hypothetical protein